MPDLCFNTLDIIGPSDSIVQFRQRAPGYGPQYKEPRDEQERRRLEEEAGTEVGPEGELNTLDFHNFVPVPPHLLAKTYGGEDEWKDTGNPHDNGHDWECKHWGCKWGACNSELIHEGSHHLLYVFDTPWSPPIPFLVATSKLFPSLEFVIEYQEIEMDHPATVWIKDGHAWTYAPDRGVAHKAYDRNAPPPALREDVGDGTPNLLFRIQGCHHLFPLLP